MVDVFRSSSIDGILRGDGGVASSPHAPTPIYTAGPVTIEEVVRQEIRSWLDINIPPMVERLVRAEIDRAAVTLGKFLVASHSPPPAE
jgi:hypothetical protein